MIREQKFRPVWGIVILIMLGTCFLLSGTGYAGKNKSLPINITVKSVFSSFLKGDAGIGVDAPEFKDLFRAGYGGVIEGEYLLTRNGLLIAGFGMEKYPGKTYQGLDFSDLTVFPFYGGYKYRLPAVYRVMPFFTLTGGAAHLSSVYVVWHSVSRSYWKTSWAPFGNAGLGIDFDWGSLHFSGSIGLRYTGAPDNAIHPARADGFWSIPFTFGIRFAF